MKSKRKKEKKKRNIIVYIILIISLLLIYSHYIEPYNLIIKEYKIENKQIPKSFDGIKIVHFSDIHYGTIVNNDYLEKIVKLINKQKPDIVVFTGDFLDERTKLSKKEIGHIKKILSKIDTKLGNYAINGNHDIKDIKIFNEILKDNFKVLDNEEKIIYYDSEIPISIVGLSDSRKTKQDISILEKNSNNFKIVLTHEPDDFDYIKKYNFNVMFSGHSHNGQIRLPFIGAIYTPKGANTYYDEYYKIDNKEIFISNGIGTSLIDLRFNSKPSINLYRLYAQ